MTSAEQASVSEALAGAGPGGTAQVAGRSKLAVSAGIMAMLAGTAILLHAGGSMLLFAVCLLTLGVLGTMAMAAGQNRGRLAATLVLAFSLRVLAAVLVSFLLIAEAGRPYIGGDDFDFDCSGRQLAAAWRNGQYDYQLEYRSDREVDNFYNYVVAAAYVASGWLGGEDNPLAVVLVNCLAGGLVAVVVYVIAQRQFGARVARRAALLAAFAPDLLLYSAVGLRDMLLALTISVFVLCLARSSGRSFTLGTATTLLATGFLAIAGLRRELLPAMLAVLGANLLLFMLPSREISPRMRARARCVLFLAVVPGTLLLAPLLAGGLSSVLDPVTRYLAYFDSRAATGSLGILLYRLPWLLRGPALLANLMALPFPPWTYLQESSGGWACIYPLLNAEVPFWYVIAPFSIIGGLWGFRAGRVKYFPVYGSTGLLLAAMSFGGAVDTRWRTMVMPLLLVLAAAGWEYRREFPHIISGWWLAMAAAVAAYLALKV